MKPEDIVCSLELSKELKELGVPQESYWTWCQGIIAPFAKHLEEWVLRHTIRPSYVDCGAWDCISAFTVAELGMMLPTGIVTSKSKDGYECSDLISTDFVSLNEANARAKMLIHLIKQGIVDPKEIG